MDFTDSGIQVVKLTPQYFARMGWEVHYVVARDFSKNGSYHYQDLVNPLGVSVHRIAMPSCGIGERLNHHILRTIYSKLRGYVAVVKLAFMAYSILKLNDIEIIYGGGPHGVLAAKVVQILFYQRRKLKIVSRFYGVWDLYSRTIIEHRWIKLMLNFDLILSLYLRSNLLIITNDGTQGNMALSRIRPKNLNSLKFYVNGVNDQSVLGGDLDGTLRSLLGSNAFTVVCITRLVSLKRIDRCIRVASSVVHKFGMHNFRLIIVGEGGERVRYEELAANLDVSRNIIFTGAVNNQMVKNYLAISNAFLSMYDASNVGNPLLEAIRANKIIFTLNNGDTSSWITHGLNGFIYDVDESTTDRVAQDIVRVAHDLRLQEFIQKNIKATELEKLWTWDERLHAEFEAVKSLSKV